MALDSSFTITAGGDVDVIGQEAVAQVVMNRVFSGFYPNNVCGVVYQNAHRRNACQFTFACDNVPDVVTEPDMWEQAKTIARDTLDGKLWLAEIGKSTHYHAYWVHPWWVRTMRKLSRIGVHTFYRPRRWGDGAHHLIDPRTGRIHTSYHQAVAATGRLSSSDPNLQNIPIRTPEGRRIRQAFVAPPGFRLLAADYSQIELRIMAHLSGDEGLCRAFAEGALPEGIFLAALHREHRRTHRIRIIPTARISDRCHVINIQAKANGMNLGHIALCFQCPAVRAFNLALSVLDPFGVIVRVCIPAIDVDHAEAGWCSLA